MPDLPSLRVPLNLDDSDFQNGMKANIGRIKEFGVAAAGLAAGIGAITFTGLESLDALNKLSDRSGVLVEELSKLEFVGKLNDASLDDIANGLKNIRESVGAGLLSPDGTEAESFRLLNIQLDAFAKLSAAEQFGVLADALNRIEDPSIRARLGTNIIKDGYQALLPLLQQGSRGMEEQAEIAAALGLVFKDDVADNASAALDSLTTLWEVVSSIPRAFAGLFAQEIKQVTDFIIDVIPGLLVTAETVLRSLGHVDNTIDELNAGVFSLDFDRIRGAVGGFLPGFGRIREDAVQGGLDRRFGADTNFGSDAPSSVFIDPARAGRRSTVSAPRTPRGQIGMSTDPEIVTLLRDIRQGILKIERSGIGG